MTTLNLNQDYESGSDITNSRIIQYAEERGWKFIRNVSWPTEMKLGLEGAEWEYRTAHWSISAMKFGDNGIAAITMSSGQITAIIYTDQADTAEEIIDRLKLLYPILESDDPEVVPVHFWTDGPNGPEATVRNLKVPDWNNISDNYAGNARSALSKVMNDKWRPGNSGQLLLWLGQAGTGKTTALRALAKEWKEWCEIHYIVDIEQFFGSHGAKYMMGVLLGANAYESDEEKYRLIVLEDAGEMLAADARTKVGQSLSRLLNIVDGLIGQGLNVMILATSNEELGKLHEAVSRPGRCAVRIKFSPLNAKETEQWMEKHNVEAKVSNKTLAELYAMTDDFDVIDATSEQSIGFGS